MSTSKPKRKKTVIEINASFAKAETEFEARGITVSITPPLDEDYFIARVKLYRDQAVQIFPKFGTIGCGFAKETDWNTNLPIACAAEKTADHIFHNRKYKKITRKQVIKAITILQDFCVEMGLEKRERIGTF
jgi:hypothetical protein